MSQSPGHRTPASPRILLVSGSSRVRTAASLNHKVYADRRGMPYVYDATPSAAPRITFHKVRTLQAVLPLADWVFWIDDDAFFTDMSVDVRAFVPGSDAIDLVFCASPVNPEGGWTWMSSGQFLMRRTPRMLALLEAVAGTDMDAIRASWQPDVHGLWTNGDQDAFVHHLTRPDSPWADSYERLPWERFNSRPYHYVDRLDEHFLCHFAVPGRRSKQEMVVEFAQRMGTSNALVAPGLLEPYRTFIEHSELRDLLADEAPAARSAPGARSPAPAPSRRGSLAARGARALRRRLGRLAGG